LKYCVGAEEGIYAWVAANYALGTLGGDPNDTTGIIELGGASVQVRCLACCITLRNQSSFSKTCWVLTVLLFFIKQVTLVTGEPVPLEFSHVLKFGDVSYNLYSHSFLHLGLVSSARKHYPLSTFS
jgi:apyrase